DPARAEERQRVEVVADGGEVEPLAVEDGHGERRVGVAEGGGDDRLAGAALEEVLVADEGVDRVPRGRRLVEEGEGVHASQETGDRGQESIPVPVSWLQS